MYIINVDNQDWLVGDSKGWLTTAPQRSMAAVYTTLPDAQEALAYYANTYPNITFIIHTLNDLAQINSHPIFENFSNGMVNGSNNALMQKNCFN